MPNHPGYTPLCRHKLISEPWTPYNNSARVGSASGRVSAFTSGRRSPATILKGLGLADSDPSFLMHQVSGRRLSTASLCRHGDSAHLVDQAVRQKCLEFEGRCSGRVLGKWKQDSQTACPISERKCRETARHACYCLKSSTSIPAMVLWGDLRLFADLVPLRTHETPHRFYCTVLQLHFFRKCVPYNFLRGRMSPRKGWQCYTLLFGFLQLHEDLTKMSSRSCNPAEAGRTPRKCIRSMLMLRSKVQKR